MIRTRVLKADYKSICISSEMVMEERERDRDRGVEVERHKKNT
jgi:hypothetical protein